MRSSVSRIASIILALLILPVLVVCCTITQPNLHRGTTTNTSIDIDRIAQHLHTLSIDCHPRDYKHIDNLNRVADYIQKHLRAAGGSISRQSFRVNKREYHNIIAHFPGSSEQTIIIGAHYDSNDDTPGADDNASGIAGLIELAYLLQKTNLPHNIELVAFTLEEPPYFGGVHMGSYQHAQSLIADNRKNSILGMISLEKIGRAHV